MVLGPVLVLGYLLLLHVDPLDFLDEAVDVVAELDGGTATMRSFCRGRPMSFKVWTILSERLSSWVN